MEAHRQLDTAGRAGRLAAVALALASLLSAQTSDDSYQRGVALAQAARWDGARTVLLTAHRRYPDEARFPIELAGIAFKQKRYSEAANWLRQALSLNSSDAYAADFLATVYFLQGNLEAALKYWNRAGKPRLENVRVEPGLRIDPVLLDRAFTFAPGDTLSLSGLLDTRARLHGLGIFPAFTVRLDAREDGGFDAVFAAREKNGFGNTKLEALVSAFRGIGYQTLHPDYFNIGRSAINLESLVRWDVHKRRLTSSLSGPFGRYAARRYRIGVDLRDEDWQGGLHLRRSAVSGEVSSASGTWNWSAGGELSHRSYQDVAAWQLKQFVRVNRELLRLPERRFESTVGFSSELATVWTAPARTFERSQASLAWRWLPRMTGDDYAIRQQVRAGRTFGRAPFDELFMLGLERDNDLWLRAHIGSRDGRKGSAPLGQRYLLFNSEIDKNVYKNGFFSVKLSPFCDIGAMHGEWLFDTGLQVKFRVLGAGVTLTYGRDLRSGKHAFYVAEPRPQL